MAKYVVVNAAGQATAFYDLGIHGGAIPSGAISISDALYAQWVQNVQGFVYDVSTGTLSPATPTPPSATALSRYANTVQSNLANGGYTANAGSTGGPAVPVQVTTTTDGMRFLQGAVSVAQQVPTQTFSWVQSDGSTIPLTAAQIIQVGLQVAAFEQEGFNTLSAVTAAIVAGTIKAKAQIDTPPAPIPAWPSNTAIPSL